MTRVARYGRKAGGCSSLLVLAGDEELFVPFDTMIYVGRDGLEAACEYSDSCGFQRSAMTEMLLGVVCRRRLGLSRGIANLGG